MDKDQIMEIIMQRENKLDEWLKKDPEKLSISKLKKSQIEWRKEIVEARNFTKKYDSIMPKENLGFAYTLLNEFSAFRAHYMVAIIYIKKLENKQSKSGKKTKHETS